MKEDKIQTGLRIPQDRYNEIKELADRAGVSINSMILTLVDIGLSAINRGIEAEAHSFPRNPQYTDEQ